MLSDPARDTPNCFTSNTASQNGGRPRPPFCASPPREAEAQTRVERTPEAGGATGARFRRLIAALADLADASPDSPANSPSGARRGKGPAEAKTQSRVRVWLAEFHRRRTRGSGHGRRHEHRPEVLAPRPIWKHDEPCSSPPLPPAGRWIGAIDSPELPRPVPRPKASFSRHRPSPLRSRQTGNRCPTRHAPGRDRGPARRWPAGPARVRRGLSNWATLHRRQGLDGPFTSPALRSVLRLAGRASSGPRRRKNRCAVTRDVLDRLLVTSPPIGSLTRATSGSSWSPSPSPSPPGPAGQRGHARTSRPSPRSRCPEFDRSALPGHSGLAAPRRLRWTTKASCHGRTRSEGLFGARTNGRLSDRSGAAWRRVAGGCSSPGTDPSSRRPATTTTPIERAGKR